LGVISTYQNLVEVLPNPGIQPTAAKARRRVTLEPFGGQHA